jgi:hypothetical protein
MTEDLFTNKDQNNEIDLNKNYLEELVGEGKKFKSPEDLARGKFESDNYIKILQQRFDELREDHERVRSESAAKARLEEILDKMDKFQKDDDHTDNPNDDVRQPESKPFDPKQLEDLIASKFTERELQRKQQENFTAVKEKLKEHYGENYQSALKDQIDNLGLTKEFFNDLAKNHPNVLFRTLGLDQPTQKQPMIAPPRGSATFKPSTPKKRTYSYYQQMRKDNPKLYFDREIAVQMHNDAQEQGEAFFDVTV